MTAITASKVIVDAIQFTLPITTFLLASAVYVKTLNLFIKLLVRECHKINSSSWQIGQILVAAAFSTVFKQDLQNSYMSTTQA